MQYQNPVIRGYYPDPSVCKAGGRYFLVASSFQFFPGVPLFESGDLVNWRQIGFCLTRESQLPLEGIKTSCGIYAPTIRYNEGRFYMVTTNVGGGGNFYVYTDDIYGEWSEPVFVDQGGIDPSLYFENGKAYFMSNGTDTDGKNAIFQCEIDIADGKKLTESALVWHGAGGRFLESPHLYKIKNEYYLTAAEGGTEYGHMVVYAKGGSLWGPFTPYAHNPVVTNRNLGSYQLQGVGHADLIEDSNSNWWMYALAFRQINKSTAYHHLGRETCLMPVTFDQDGWFTVDDGTARLVVETDRIPQTVKQQFPSRYSFAEAEWNREWQFVRVCKKENYIFGKGNVKIKSSGDTLDTPDGNPSFLGLHQKEFNMELSFCVKALDGEAGVTVYMDENHHYDLALLQNGGTYRAALRLNIGDIKHEKAVVPVSHSEVRLRIRSDAVHYTFSFIEDGLETVLGTGQAKYLSSEVAGGFTGVLLGLYSQGAHSGLFNEFYDFECSYS
ncbi:MAG: glycoside hydrolase family 43 protein [Treponema sp.]|nr:glycoside hydrolase family 43 protein [Treponema sp.]